MPEIWGTIYHTTKQVLDHGYSVSFSWFVKFHRLTDSSLTKVHDLPWPLDTRKSLELTYLEGFTRCIQVRM